jgi:hypothetical protein
MTDDLKKKIEALEAQATGYDEHEQRMALETRRINEMIDRAVRDRQDSD